MIANTSSPMTLYWAGVVPASMRAGTVESRRAFAMYGDGKISPGRVAGTTSMCRGPLDGCPYEVQEMRE